MFGAQRFVHTGLAATAAMLITTLTGSFAPTAVAAGAATGSAPTVSTIRTIPLPGHGGHGDVVIADPAAQLVYVAQSPDDNVVVINAATKSIRAVIGHIPQANGIAYNDRYVFVAEAPTGRVAVISKATLQVVATVPSGGKTPDGVYYDSRDDAVAVVNDGSNNMTFFSAESPFAAVRTVGLRPSSPKTGPDLGTYVSASDTIYQADDNDVLTINAATGIITKSFPLPLRSGQSAKDMFYDAGANVLWVASTASEVFAVDPATGAILATVRTASGIDQMSADEQQHLLLLGESTAGVLGIVDMAAHKAVTDVRIEPNFHTLDHMPGTNVVYVYLNKSNKVEVDTVTARAPAAPTTAGGHTSAGVVGTVVVVVILAVLAGGVVVFRRARAAR